MYYMDLASTVRNPAWIEYRGHPSTRAVPIFETLARTCAQLWNTELTTVATFLASAQK